MKNFEVDQKVSYSAFDGTGENAVHIYSTDSFLDFLQELSSRDLSAYSSIVFKALKEEKLTNEVVFESSDMDTFTNMILSLKDAYEV